MIKQDIKKYYEAVDDLVEKVVTILLRESPRLQSWDESKGFPLCQ